jgi:hypothetical protein
MKRGCCGTDALKERIQTLYNWLLVQHPTWSHRRVHDRAVIEAYKGTPLGLL